MAVDPKHLLNFLAIAEEGSFTKASLALNLSQPALSTSIAILESRLKAKLLERSYKGAEVNDLGEIVVRRAQELRELLRATEVEIAEKAAGREGPLIVGATPGMMLSIMPELLSSIIKMHPGLVIDIIEGWDGTLGPMLAAGELDFYFGSITSVDHQPDDILEELLYADRLALGVNAESPWLGREYVSIAELLDQRWVLPHSGAHLRHVEALFATSGIELPRLCTRTNSLSLTEELVVRTGAVTIVSDVQVHRQGQHRMRSLPLKEAGAKSVVVRRRAISRLSPAAEDALACLRDICKPMAAFHASQ